MSIDLGTLHTAMVTPFKDDLSVDYDKTEELAAYLVDNGSEGLVVSGTTGEAPTLSDDEKVKLYKVVKNAVGDRAKVIAGTGYNCTRESIFLTKEAEKVGVDACMLVVPYYNKPPQEGLYNHFKMVAENTSLPVILYNVPARTITNLDAETVIRLSQVNNIVAVKEASGDLEQIEKIIFETGDDFLVLSGEDACTYPMLSLGANGVISVAAHVAGNEIKEMLEVWKNGDKQKACDIHERLLPLFETLFLTTNPIMVKAALNLKGINVGGLRPPMIEATDEQIDKLKTLMQQMNLL